ncbi:hypothetical protein [Flavobacterium sp. HJJ]|uniref:hypothetical protein n=1 Tax=Flavobacterium sp. HJJ TaxID=2783792 RepID=UPI00188D7FEE|nr:hypothetical protein [Flavobacterium sp. HJJ]MBF4473425.1 hypothetical protein [Flavobacterium sp. HJJ]
MNINFFGIFARLDSLNHFIFNFMDTNNEIRLRLRFYKEVDQNIDSLRQKFIQFTTTKSPDFILKIKEYHIWINIKGSKKAYWSPHLHIEMESKGENRTNIRGLFGPDPGLWTFFMFLHFMIAGTFIIFCGIAYSDYVLKRSTSGDFVVMSLMIFAWFLLYVIAKQIRSNGEKQMNDIEKVFLEIIET